MLPTTAASAYGLKFPVMVEAETDHVMPASTETAMRNKNPEGQGSSTTSTQLSIANVAGKAKPWPTSGDQARTVVRGKPRAQRAQL